MSNKPLPLPVNEPDIIEILPYANILPLKLILPLKVEPNSSEVTISPVSGETDAVTEPETIFVAVCGGTTMFVNLLPSP